MSVTVDNLTFDFTAKTISVEPARGPVLLVQDLLDAIRAAEFTDEGMLYTSIANGNGKQTLSGATAVGVTLELLNNWQVVPYGGSYQFVISGGNLVGGISDQPVAYVPNVQVVRELSANATVVTTGGSALTPTEAAQLAAVKAKTDQMAFTNPNQVDVNVKSLNDTELLGTGTDGDKWRG